MKYIKYDNDGDIIGTVESNDNSLVVDEKDILNIEDEILWGEIKRLPHDFIVVSKKVKKAGVGEKARMKEKFKLPAFPQTDRLAILEDKIAKLEKRLKG
jgi:hypothetical protein